MTKKFHKLNEMMMDPLKVLFFTIYIKIKIRSLHHKTLKFLTNTEKLKINKKANKVCKKKKKKKSYDDRSGTSKFSLYYIHGNEIRENVS